MNRNRILSLLKTKGLGRNVLLFDEVDSTNSVADRLYDEGSLEAGMVVIANHQTAGRGRLARHWHSEGGLCMTAAIEVPRPIASPGAITLTAGAAVALAISELTGGAFAVKYPNDIMADGKKLGGILSEMKTRGKTFILLGAGINVSQESFPEEIAEIAVSLAQLGYAVDRESVAAAVLNRLESFVELFLARGFAAIRPYWMDVNCTLGKQVRIESPGGAVEGKAVNIDEEGALMVDTGDGVRRVLAGDIIHR